MKTQPKVDLVRCNFLIPIHFFGNFLDTNINTFVGVFLRNETHDKSWLFNNCNMYFS